MTAKRKSEEVKHHCTPAFTPAEVFHPGEYVQDELDARGWDLVVLADTFGIAVDDIAKVVAEKASITPEIAAQLGTLMGQNPETWLRLQEAYDAAARERFGCK